jgi:hypothetical protein
VDPEQPSRDSSPGQLWVLLALGALALAGIAFALLLIISSITD